MTDASDNAPSEEAVASTAPEEGAVATLTSAAVDVAPSVVPVPHAKQEHDLSPFAYVMIALGLCVLTALEVGLWYLEGNQTEILGWQVFSNGWIVLYLGILAFAKFVIVAGWYMHLSSDAPIFRRYFMLGAFSAFFLLFMVLLTL